VIPDLSVFWVVFFLLLLTFVMNALLFRPLRQVMAQREAAVASARGLAEQAAEQARQATLEFDTRTREARTELFKQMEAARKAALERRSRILADTRAEADAAIQHASDQLRADAEAARAQLDRQADSLATTIVERVLGRPVS
jgi:F-type H+-transporting ATPase subunit b